MYCIYTYLNLIFAYVVTLVFTFSILSCSYITLPTLYFLEKLFSCELKMPKVRRSKKPPPDGWELIEPTLEELEQKMREAETEPHEGKRKQESLWPIFKIHHQKSRYIYDLYYRRKAISRELYDYCLNENIADKNLIAKWKKVGYENLCCLRCIQTRDTNFGTNCICRVPKGKLEEGRIVECIHCGCRGCSG
ncbi:protein BUD31 homolog [Apis cerana]|nr:protein BUD31 homolog [Apis cerana]